MSVLTSDNLIFRSKKNGKGWRPLFYFLWPRWTSVYVCLSIDLHGASISHLPEKLTGLSDNPYERTLIGTQAEMKSIHKLQLPIPYSIQNIKHGFGQRWAWNLLVSKYWSCSFCGTKGIIMFLQCFCAKSLVASLDISKVELVFSISFLSGLWVLRWCVISNEFIRYTFFLSE